MNSESGLYAQIDFELREPSKSREVFAKRCNGKDGGRVYPMMQYLHAKRREPWESGMFKDFWKLWNQWGPDARG